jgi:acyl-CoA dehydrogenase
LPIGLFPPPADETENLSRLRQSVREFLYRERAADTYSPWVDTWLTNWDNSFTKRLAEQGWLGMTIPSEYGGHGKTFLERFVVTEELLAGGAPLAAHWVADRQIAPSILKYGTEYQKQTYLPQIAAGDVSFGIGMSEPDSGSDLASVKTKGVKVSGGWQVTGTKVWTSGAHHADRFIVLARTSALDTSNRHAGLSQFIVDLKDPQVTVNVIASMNGSQHFNEVVLDSVFVPEDHVFGTIGNGWEQVTSELSYERSGPERVLSTYPLLEKGLASSHRQEFLPHLAQVVCLRRMSFSIANALARGESADTAAAIVKVLGTKLEGDIAETADRLRLDNSEDLNSMTSASILQRPGFTLRGGTTEILNGIIARQLGLR